MLELHRVSKRYDSVRALDECTLRAAAGRLTGFVGPNGAGKTTAMRVIFGLVSPDSGDTWWNGQVIDSSTRRRFGYMPEERGLYPRMRVRDQLVFFGRLCGLTSPGAARAADRWLDALGLTDRSAARLDDLSHGNQQRVQLAAALLHEPELVVLDEPFSGLDPFAMDSMSTLLAQVAQSGAAVLFSSHQLDVVQHLCEDVVVIDSGHVVLEGRLDEIRDAALDRYVDVTTKGDLRPLLDLEGVTVVARDDGHVRLRVPRGAEPGTLLQAVGRDVVRMSYEPPTLSELFRTAVAEARESADVEV
ncbi:MAG: ABC transporter ATP-binding protein [Jiangellaceae bacterium]